MIESWNERSWETLAMELDAWRPMGRQATVWWRDDDAGSSDPALDTLLSLANMLGLPLGLAVVPAWLGADLPDALRSAPDTVVVLQHGFAHVNHEREIPPGERKVRPAECGAARSPGEVLAEAVEGAARLRAHFATRFLPVFVPPWNRIAPEVIAGLPDAGFRGLSVFRPRRVAHPAPGLVQVNCHVDPILWRERKRFAGAAHTLENLCAHLAARRERRVDPAEPTGLLTHHRDLDAAGWVFLRELFGRLQKHPAVAFPPLPSLLAASTEVDEWRGG